MGKNDIELIQLQKVIYWLKTPYNQWDSAGAIKFLRLIRILTPQ